MHIDVNQSPALFELASKRLGGHYRKDLGHAILSAISPAGVVAQAVLTGICPGVKCELTLWAERDHGLAGRRLLRQVCHVAFIQFQCKRMHAVTGLNNRRAQAVLKKMGFEVEAYLEAWFGTDHGVMFKMMLPSAERWLQPEKTHADR